MHSRSMGPWMALDRGANKRRLGPTRSTSRTLKFLLAAAVLIGTSAASVSPASAAWRAFAPTSVWNVPAAQKGAIATSNPYAAEFTSYSSTLEVSGVGSNQWAKPVYFATPGDPARTGVDVNGWPQGDIRYDGGPIPVPPGLAAATGSDGHVTIVSADRTKAWDMWRCKQQNGAPCTEQNVLASGFRAEVIVQWDLNGSGVPGDTSDNTSARGSGTPLIPTTLRADEALGGIDHALGLTIPNVARSYVYPATHSDGGAGSVQYGTLFVLRSDFPVPANASLGARNIITALKTYGAYVVDQGASMQLDGDSTRPDLWSQAGLSGTPSLPVHASDWRLVNVGAAPAPAPAPVPITDPGSGGTAGKTCNKQRQKRGKCTLVRATAVATASGEGQAVVKGSVPAKEANLKRRARVQMKTPKGWKTIGTAEVRSDGTFKLHLPRKKGRRKVRIRVVVPGVGISKAMTVRL
jgi:hypothetical protein